MTFLDEIIRKLDEVPAHKWDVNRLPLDGQEKVAYRFAIDKYPVADNSKETILRALGEVNSSFKRERGSR